MSCSALFLPPGYSAPPSVSLSALSPSLSPSPSATFHSHARKHSAHTKLNNHLYKIGNNTSLAFQGQSFLARRSFRVDGKLFKADVSRKFQTVNAMAPMEILVKAATGNPTVLGDCPFSQRVLLTLEEKKVPYEAKLVDTANKPEWFLQINPDGKVPVIKVDGKWVADSDVIVDVLEKSYPEPSLVAPESVSSVGSKLFSSFVKFLKSQDASDETEGNLKGELKALDDHLTSTSGPFVAGEKLSSVDLSLAPKLYHLRIALKHFKNFTVPEEFSHVKTYIEALESLESFKKTAASEEIVVNGWKRALGL